MPAQKGGRHDLDQESEEKSNAWWTRPRSGAAALTAVAWLTFVSFGLGAVGIGFTVLGFVAPNLLHIQKQRKTPDGGAIGCSRSSRSDRLRAAPAWRRCERRDVGLFIGGRIVVGRGAAAGLQERNAA
ncbi:MAG: hypothetical protein Q8M19_01365 [Reyranella sp.]|nr:hypothetical protein [Reyranella sp.]